MHGPHSMLVKLILSPASLTLTLSAAIDEFALSCLIKQYFLLCLKDYTNCVNDTVNDPKALRVRIKGKTIS